MIAAVHRWGAIGTKKAIYIFGSYTTFHHRQYIRIYHSQIQILIFINMKQIILTLILSLLLASCYIEPVIQREHRYRNNYWLFDAYYYSPYPYNPYRYYDLPHNSIRYPVPRVVVPAPPIHRPRQNSLYPQYSPRIYPGNAPIRSFPHKKK